MPPAQNPHQTVTRCGCIYFSLITRGFSEPQTRQFWRLSHRGENVLHCLGLFCSKNQHPLFDD